MNKQLIVLLAVCLVAVHAYVKRDAPAPPADDNYLEKIKTTFEELGTKVKETFKPEDIQKSFNQALENVNKFIEDVKAKNNAPAPAA